MSLADQLDYEVCCREAAEGLKTFNTVRSVLTKEQLQQQEALLAELYSHVEARCGRIRGHLAEESLKNLSATVAFAGERLGEPSPDLRL